VYNSFAVNHVFAANRLVKKWFASGSPTFLVEKIKEGNFEIITADGVEVSFDRLNESCNPDNINATSLLYYAGYATMQSYEPESDQLRLVSPNLEVSRSMASHLLDLFKTKKDTDLGRIAFEFVQCFRLNKLELIQETLNQALAQVTYRLLQSEERYFHFMLYFLFELGNMHSHLEVETNNGRMDMMFETSNRIFIIELKFNKPAVEGLQQIKDKNYARKYLIKGLPIIGVGISIALKRDDQPHGTENRCVFDVAWERLN
jgi:hypothetical protein